MHVCIHSYLEADYLYLCRMIGVLVKYFRFHCSKKYTKHLKYSPHMCKPKLMPHR